MVDVKILIEIKTKIITIHNTQYSDKQEHKTCPKGFGPKLAKLGLKIPLKNKV